MRLVTLLLTLAISLASAQFTPPIVIENTDFIAVFAAGFSYALSVVSPGGTIAIAPTFATNYSNPVDFPGFPENETGLCDIGSESIIDPIFWSDHAVAPYRVTTENITITSLCTNIPILFSTFPITVPAVLSAAALKCTALEITTQNVTLSNMQFETGRCFTKLANAPLSQRQQMLLDSPTPALLVTSTVDVPVVGLVLENITFTNTPVAILFDRVAYDPPLLTLAEYIQNAGVTNITAGPGFVLSVRLDGVSFGTTSRTIVAESTIFDDDAITVVDTEMNSCYLLLSRPFPESIPVGCTQIKLGRNFVDVTGAASNLQTGETTVDTLVEVFYAQNELSTETIIALLSIIGFLILTAVVCYVMHVFQEMKLRHLQNAVHEVAEQAKRHHKRD